jgi:hypothetical protein
MMPTNQDNFMNGLRTRITQLLDSNPSGNPAWTAREWFAANGGSQPAAVNQWVAAQLDELPGEEFVNGTIGPNGERYCQALSDRIGQLAESDEDPDGWDIDTLAAHSYWRDVAPREVRRWTQQALPTIHSDVPVA